MEWAQSHEVGAPLLEGDMTTHHFNHVGSSNQVLDERRGNGHSRLSLWRPMQQQMEHSATKLDYGPPECENPRGGAVRTFYDSFLRLHSYTHCHNGKFDQR
jgi:hypothetical protein